MKSIICLILFWLIVCTGYTQTNQANSVTAAPTNKPKVRYALQPPLPPGYAALTNIHKQIAAIQVKIDKLNGEENIRLKRRELNQAAGNIASTQTERKAETARRSNYAAAIHDYRRQIAQLQLQEFEIRQRYKIPESSANNLKIKR